MLLIMLLTIVIVMTACGGADASSSKGSGGKSGGSGGSGGSDSSGGSGGYAVPAFKDAVYSADSAEGNDEVQVDLSSTADGYFALYCETDARVKLQVFKGDDTFVYDVVQGKPQVFPLQSGDGLYTIKVMKNIESNKYFELYSVDADVALSSEFEPFLRPSQYADYNKDSKCVKKAAEIAAVSSNESDFITNVFDFVCGSVTYDYDLAENLQPGYIPVPDQTMTSGKGICFDYASLSASMLRSQGIPTKIIFGYVAPDDLYHAWNMYYTKESGWVAVEFETGANSWNRIDATFLANGANASFIGDGSNYEDVYQY